MTNFLLLFIALLVGVFFVALFKKFHLPFVASLLLGGVIIGPNGLGYFEPNEAMSFFSELGLVFLMFMVGFEVKFSNVKEVKKELGSLMLFRSIPFFVGFLIGMAFGYDLVVSSLIGIVFISTSVAVVVPSIEKYHLFDKKLGRTIVSAAMIEDILGLLLFSIILQEKGTEILIPLPILYIVIFLLLVFSRMLLNKLDLNVFKNKIFILKSNKEDLFQQGLRIVFTVLIGTVVLFEFLGVHLIITSFLVGLIFSEIIENEVLIRKIRTISYSFFIPIFFIMVGANTNLKVFLDGNTLPILGAILAGSILSKFFSGWAGAKLTGFDSKESAIFASATIPQLSTTLAVAFAGYEFGILDEKIVASMVVLSVVTALLGPLLIDFFEIKKA